VLARSGRRQGDCSKQLGRRRRTCACRVPDECAGRTVCHEQLTVVKTADELRWFNGVICNLWQWWLLNTMVLLTVICDWPVRNMWTGWSFIVLYCAWQLSVWFLCVMYVFNWPGYGLMCHRVIKTCAEIMGIKDLHCKVEDNTTNYQAIVRAFFDALIHQVWTFQATGITWNFRMSFISWILRPWKFTKITGNKYSAFSN